jgi:hypothetical protein
MDAFAQAIRQVPTPSAPLIDELWLGEGCKSEVAVKSQHGLQISSVLSNRIAAVRGRFVVSEWSA